MLEDTRDQDWVSICFFGNFISADALKPALLQDLEQLELNSNATVSGPSWFGPAHPPNGLTRQLQACDQCMTEIQKLLPRSWFLLSVWSTYSLPLR
jgi:hypothetical protein